MGKTKVSEAQRPSFRASLADLKLSETLVVSRNTPACPDCGDCADAQQSWEAHHDASTSSNKLLLWKHLSNKTLYRQLSKSMKIILVAIQKTTAWDSIVIKFRVCGACESSQCRCALLLGPTRDRRRYLQDKPQRTSREQLVNEWTIFSQALQHCSSPKRIKTPIPAVLNITTAVKLYAIVPRFIPQRSSMLKWNLAFRSSAILRTTQSKLFAIGNQRLSNCEKASLQRHTGFAFPMGSQCVK